VRTIYSAPDANYLRDDKPASFWGLGGSASLHDKELVLSVVNPHVSEIREAEIVLHGANVKSGTATVLTNSVLNAHNTFEQRNAVSPQMKDVPSTGKTITFQFPAASVTKLALALV
jgi:alpha-L-arabinofuranosidase